MLTHPSVREEVVFEFSFYLSIVYALAAKLCVISKFQRQIASVCEREVASTLRTADIAANTPTDKALIVKG